MTVGRPFNMTFTFLEAPSDIEKVQCGDILVSPKAFYLVHSSREVKSKVYPYRYSLSCSRVSPDDESIPRGKQIKIFSATKEYLEKAKSSFPGVSRTIVSQ
jgi:hypothetical protein